MKNRLTAMMQSAVLASGLAVILDALSVVCGRALSVPKFGALLAGLFLVLWLVPAVTPKRRKQGLLVLGTGAAVLLLSLQCWFAVSQNVVYMAPDEGKAALYGGKKIMLLVPHQDDDINVLGGVIEEYVKYGSEVCIVYSTNGDYYGQAEIRFREALAAAEKMGVPGERVIFLGYGDQWSPDGPHLYNAAPETIVSSYLGRTETYGTEAHDVYRAGTAYTPENFLGDLKQVILEHRADVLYCVDHDYNIDHRALSLAFEKVMGRILKEEPDYRPLVFKGFAYDTAWEAEKDFYGENLLSTRNILEAPYEEKPIAYRWEERIRLPVHGENLSRSVLSALWQDTLAVYESQDAQLRGVRVFNGDKVFWKRRTDSLCHQANLEAESGGAEVLNDFMLLEDRDLRNKTEDLRDGAWIPEQGKASVKVTFDQPRDVETVILYDLPDRTANVLNAEILFDDGTVVETGPLDPCGAASRFRVDRKSVSSFAVRLTHWEGMAGLVELEAFSGPEETLPYVKLMDADGHFVYDYWIDPSGSQLFSLYSGGVDTAGYTLECSNNACAALWEGEKIHILCPRGEKTAVTAVSPDGRISDSVFVRNPGFLERKFTMFWLRAEEIVMDLCAVQRIHERLFVCRMWEKVPAILTGIWH